MPVVATRSPLLRQRADLALCLLLGSGRQHRRAGRDREAELELRPIRHRRLLRVPIRGIEIGVQHLDDVQAGVSGGGNGEARGSVGRHHDMKPVNLLS